MAGRSLPSPDIESLVSQIDDAAVEPAGWPRVLEAVMNGLHATAASFLSADMNAPQSALSLWVRLDPDFPRLYNARYHALDPWAIEARKRGWLKSGAAGPSESLCGTNELARTEFGNDFAFPLGVVHGMSGVVLADRGRVSAISLYRDERREAFDDHEVAPLRVLLPHLARALRIHNKCSAIRAQELALAEAVDRLSSGVVFTDRHGSVVFLNRAAEQMTAKRDGLQIRRGKLEAATQPENDQLRAMIRAASESAGAAQHTPPRGLAVSRPSLTRPFLLFVSALGPRSSPSQLVPDGERRAEAVVFIDDPAAERCPPMQLLQPLYGLTPAEARLAEALVHGSTLEEVAARFEVSIHTVRSQLKALFSKTGTRRQAELVRVLMAGIGASGM